MGPMKTLKTITALALVVPVGVVALGTAGHALGPTDWWGPLAAALFVAVLGALYLGTSLIVDPRPLRSARGKISKV